MQLQSTVLQKSRAWERDEHSASWIESESRKRDS